MAVCAHDPRADDTEERRKGYKAKMKQWFSGSRMSLEMPHRDGNSSGPPSASSNTRAHSQKDAAQGPARPGDVSRMPLPRAFRCGIKNALHRRF